SPVHPGPPLEVDASPGRSRDVHVALAELPRAEGVSGLVRYSGARAGEDGVEVVGGEVGVVERAAAVGEELVDEGDAGGVGVVRLLEGAGELKQFGSYGGDAGGEHWAAVEPARRLVW